MNVQLPVFDETTAKGRRAKARHEAEQAAEKAAAQIDCRAGGAEWRNRMDLIDQVCKARRIAYQYVSRCSNGWLQRMLDDRKLGLPEEVAIKRMCDAFDAGVQRDARKWRKVVDAYQSELDRSARLREAAKNDRQRTYHLLAAARVLKAAGESNAVRILVLQARRFHAQAAARRRQIEPVRLAAETAFVEAFRAHWGEEPHRQYSRPEYRHLPCFQIPFYTSPGLNFSPAL